MTAREPSPSISSFRLILVGLIGNVMEWYDFAVYGFFAGTLGRLFFPAEQPGVSLIASFGAFAAGFLVRPLGGLVFGRIGDRVGRQRAMLLSVMAMAIPTVLMGLLPTHATVGLLAPVLLVGLRLVQGLSVGGEYTSSLVFLVEHAPAGKRAFTAVWGAWGASAGTLLGSGVGFVVTMLLQPSQVELWGWRVPFIMGGCVAFVGFWLRRGLHVEAPPADVAPRLRDMLAQHWRPLLCVALLNFGYGVGFYTVFVYTVTFLENVSGLTGAHALRNNSVAMLLLLVIMPITAKLADAYGRKRVLGVGFTLLALTAVPLFQVMAQGIRWVTIGCELALALSVGLVAGGMAATSVELIPRAVRCTGLAFAYNVSVGIFGGMTPMIVSWMITSMRVPAAPGYWCAGAAAVSAATLFLFVPETRDCPLDS